MNTTRFVHPTDYVEDIYQTMLNADSEEVESACKKLMEMAPPPMNTMLTKQPREEAIQKMLDRKEMVVANVPPTGTAVLTVYWYYHLCCYYMYTFLVIGAPSLQHSCC